MLHAVVADSIQQQILLQNKLRKLKCNIYLVYFSVCEFLLGHTNDYGE